ncbi:hypothetical protein COW36_02465 [bacterium (Candidatus Blackallbacteria) CG17_big_fil_post_rev_8_21_14_2_50_48_46]|uniref:ATP-grasp domain-containing protein n=1 Tax=bacterium (Candidatus Blackallbacteria) CG17_big_fil_post_rev_8_21_14_2_50_48_46 TaxID=2014261 RepID=A0A2M7GA20_9BACT|nr:MAG: hypothetical protein COW64_13005 [bacterium (Candidatus Blackallbacteria) CG18_big_fil_WC_8_21_14_2_50_49_26]PIW18992.1 MAG: hypothetical protein COW36_02465 [bacterium (Candidatus Blackallbacteria) CG17_big_fil_post_rev_8_21_14_2_50_48_46]PIW44640.1 MAG: hypothetical protein COW20_23650 [bacterium (Candidatus Blackallbacteria) CG13_big_fil_rev_8_21_14_2_50_49_14]
MTPIFLYPADYFKPRLPDAQFQTEAKALENAGFQVQVWNGQVFSPNTPIRALYRGWMLSLKDYQNLYAQWAKAGVLPLTSPEQYGLCHYLPNWYPLLSEWTPETVRIKTPEELPEILESLNWDSYFLKDDVKSLNTGNGSHVKTLAEAQEWVREMKQFKGRIEGGICIRRWESWLPESEVRWFIWKGKAFSPQSETEIPPPLEKVLQEIAAPFFSVDLIQNSLGEWRIVELGDGQVSDLKNWSPERFADIFREPDLV